MKTNPTKSSYRRALIIETVVGSFMLLLSVGAYVLEQFKPELRGSLVWGFMFAAVISLFLASLHYSGYRSTSAE